MNNYSNIDVEQRCKEIKEDVNVILKDIENMKLYKHKIICLFSLIDMFSQNYLNYESRNFCEFIEIYADKQKYDFLKKIDPVTLLYDINNYPNTSVSIPKFKEPNIYTVDSEELNDILREIDLNKISKEIIEKHSYSRLMYKFRSKIVHERNLIGGISTETENNYEYPIYVSVSTYWKLIFPYKFLKEIFENCIYNYLEERREKNEEPFENNNEKRKALYAFYDKECNGGNKN